MILRHNGDVIKAGEISSITAKTDGTERIVEIKVANFSTALKRHFSPRYSFGPKLTVRQIIYLAATIADLKVNDESLQATFPGRFPGNRLTVFNRVYGYLSIKEFISFTWDDSVGAFLNHLKLSHGIDWFEDNQVLYFNPQHAKSKLFGFSLSRRNGLIGEPEVKQDSVKFQSVINKQVKMFHIVRLSSRYVSGDYKINSIKHFGDTYDGGFITEIEGVDNERTTV